MESYAARLASFNATHPATKKRASDPKGTKKLKWPHKNPSPPRVRLKLHTKNRVDISQLAQAGFYYQPSSSNPDNVTCYLCETNIDQWEATDDPLDEHLAHAKSCGWAAIASVERAIENGEQDVPNPASEEIIQARMATFSCGWPHESKRGWLCKIQKLVDAGWHYCPSPESDDYVRCSYCSLGLDGWEPKDNPYEEHERRSPDCLFFKSVVTAKPQSGKRKKKERGSKASRMSTQSNFTVASEAPSIAEIELALDESTSQTAAPTPKANIKKGSKKGTKGRKAASKKMAPDRNVEETNLATSHLEPEDDDFSVKIDQSPESIPNGKKRKSQQISTENKEAIMEQGAESQPPPSKRRTTRTRSSVTTTHHAFEPTSQITDQDIQMTDVEPDPASLPEAYKKSKKGGKKRGTSAPRKTSAMSAASKASLRMAIPDDDEIDAALELDLEKPLTDEEMEVEMGNGQSSKGRRLTRTKPGSKKVAASVAPTRRTTRASTVPVQEPSLEFDLSQPPPTATFEDVNDERFSEPPDDFGLDELPAKRTTGKKTGKKTAAKLTTQATEAVLKQDVDVQPVTIENDVSRTAPTQKEPQSSQNSRQRPAPKPRVSIEHDSHISLDDTQTLRDDSGHETDASVATQGDGDGENRAPSKRGKKGMKVQPARRKKEQNLQAENVEISNANVERGQSALEVEVTDHSNMMNKIADQKRATIPTKPARAAPKKTAKSKKGAIKVKAAERDPSLIPAVLEAPSSPPAPKELTPAVSPQSSDAENQPPSSRPSALRPPLELASASKLQPTRIPLATSTPTCSPSKNTFSRLQSTVPWTAADLERIFHGSPGVHKENIPFAFGSSANIGALTSPEKKLTVEQWIQNRAHLGEESLRAECERVVGNFEGEGMRALQALEGIICVE
ncbi:uncharacterized protein KY384_007133 [Bacidia gigantensis]|uniref:uncharacterized protein n=1 Tax=Bacidia gigantensis TaxID=2732470 RepID=UPI001D04AAE7|nr:uncharacterized protein KY384_007133 [Bacidia gigantensis]KAG8528216.1 hypothetical protein KY384_007133 [Bacidia gigantensis]